MDAVIILLLLLLPLRRQIGSPLITKPAGTEPTSYHHPPTLSRASPGPSQRPTSSSLCDPCARVTRPRLATSSSVGSSKCSPNGGGSMSAHPCSRTCRSRVSTCPAVSCASAQRRTSCRSERSSPKAICSSPRCKS